MESKCSCRHDLTVHRRRRDAKSTRAFIFFFLLFVFFLFVVFLSFSLFSFLVCLHFAPLPRVGRGDCPSLSFITLRMPAIALVMQASGLEISTFWKGSFHQNCSFHYACNLHHNIISEEPRHRWASNVRRTEKMFTKYLPNCRLELAFSKLNLHLNICYFGILCFTNSITLFVKTTLHGDVSAMNRSVIMPFWFSFSALRKSRG